MTWSPTEPGGQLTGLGCRAAWVPSPQPSVTAQSSSWELHQLPKAENITRDGDTQQQNHTQHPRSNMPQKARWPSHEFGVSPSPTSQTQMQAPAFVALGLLQLQVGRTDCLLPWTFSVSPWGDLGCVVCSVTQMKITALANHHSPSIP